MILVCFSEWATVVTIHQEVWVVALHLIKAIDINNTHLISKYMSMEGETQLPGPIQVQYIQT